MPAVLQAAALPTKGHVLRHIAQRDEVRLLAMYASFEPKAAASGLPPRHNVGQWLANLRGNPAFVAEAEGQIIGHAVLCPEGASAELALFVHQDWRGQGVGRELLRALIEEARAKGLHRVWGIAEPWNVSMIRLACKLGFQPDPSGAFVRRLG